jgi:hypothetical protein
MKQGGSAGLKNNHSSVLPQNFKEKRRHFPPAGIAAERRTYQRPM